MLYFKFYGIACIYLMSNSDKPNSIIIQLDTALAYFSIASENNCLPILNPKDMVIKLNTKAKIEVKSMLNFEIPAPKPTPMLFIDSAVPSITDSFKSIKPDLFISAFSGFSI